MTHEYRLLDKHYVLHADGQAAGRPLPQIGLAFDKCTGELYIHGEVARVQTWAHLSLNQWTATYQLDLADGLVVVCGRLPLAEVNRCLTEPEYCREFFTRLMAGDFAYACA